MKHRSVISLFFLSTLSNLSFGAQPVYVGNFGDHSLYFLDPATGNSSLIAYVAPGTGDGLIQFGLGGPTTGYGLNIGNSTIYNINLVTGDYLPVATLPQPGQGMALANSTTAYLGLVGNIYSVNLETGATNLVTPSLVSNTIFISTLAIRNNTAYAAGYGDTNLYAVDLQTGSTTKITAAPINSGNVGIALGRNTAYVTDPYTNEVYGVDLRTGNSFLLAMIAPAIQLTGISVVNNTTAYVADGSNIIYSLDLNTGAYSPINSSPVPGTTGFNNGIFPLTIFPQIPTNGLSGNNLKLANYFNLNAPFTTALLYLLSESELKEALEAIAPTRNGFATFAAQNGYLASSQLVTDHLHQRRLTGRVRRDQPKSVAANNLLVDASTGINPKLGQIENVSENRLTGFTGWLAGFGEYAHEKAQHETPAFSLSLGGVLAAVDYDFITDNTVGFGGSYVHSHVHQEDGMGYANVDQGFLTGYSSLHAADWLFDFALWGGYYSCANYRKIQIAPTNFFNYPIFNKTAKSHFHGWQMAPHLEVSYDRWYSIKSHPTEFAITPFLMGDWIANWESQFRESGADGYNMSQKGRFCSLFRGETGVRFRQLLEFSWGDLVFQEKGSYAYQKMFGTGTITAFLIGSPGQFTVSTLTEALNLGVVEFSLLFNPLRPTTPYLDIRYQGEFGSGYQSHQGVVEIGMSF